MGAVRVKRDVSLLPLTNCFRTAKQPKLFPKCKAAIDDSPAGAATPLQERGFICSIKP
jgi:hypothetical protein